MESVLSISAQFALIYRNNHSEVLLVKRSDIPIWNLPGDHIEADETSQDAVIREVFEETGFKVEIVKETAEYTFRNGKITYLFEGCITGGVKTLSVESKEIDCFDINQLPKMIFPYTKEFIKDSLAKDSEIIKKNLDDLPLSFWLKALLHPWALFKYLLTRFGIHWNT